MSPSGIESVTHVTSPSRKGVPSSAKVRFQNVTASRTASRRGSPASAMTVSVGGFCQWLGFAHAIVAATTTAPSRQQAKLTLLSALTDIKDIPITSIGLLEDLDLPQRVGG
jgi:hypothetical protein